MRTAALISILFTLALCGPLRAGAYTDLGTLGGSSSFAFGINDLGHVVGSSTAAGGQTHAFHYSGGVMVDLRVLSPSDNFSQASKSMTAARSSACPPSRAATDLAAGTGSRMIFTFVHRLVF